MLVFGMHKYKRCCKEERYLVIFIRRVLLCTWVTMVHSTSFKKSLCTVYLHFELEVAMEYPVTSKVDFILFYFSESKQISLTDLADTSRLIRLSCLSWRRCAKGSVGGCDSIAGDWNIFCLWDPLCLIMKLFTPASSKRYPFAQVVICLVLSSFFFIWCCCEWLPVCLVFVTNIAQFI